MRFEDLPIKLEEVEYSTDGWQRTVQKPGTVADLLEIWDIDDDTDISAMAQVLRHLRRVMENVNT